MIKKLRHSIHGSIAYTIHLYNHARIYWNRLISFLNKSDCQTGFESVAVNNNWSLLTVLFASVHQRQDALGQIHMVHVLFIRHHDIIFPHTFQTSVWKVNSNWVNELDFVHGTLRVPDTYPPYMVTHIPSVITTDPIVSLFSPFTSVGLLIITSQTVIFKSFDSQKLRNTFYIPNLYIELFS